MNWPVTPIGDLVEITQGCPFDSSLFEDQGSLPVVRIRDVVRGRSETYLKGGCEQRYLVSDGDILIGMDGDFNRARWHGGVAALNQRVCRIRANINRLDDSYLYHLLPSRLKKIEDETPFVTVKHLSSKQLNSILIPLPPLSEQRRIAAILDQAEALRAKRRAALAHLDEMAQAIFVEMFESPLTKHARRPSITLQQACSQINDCPHSTPKWTETGIVCLRTSNLSDGNWNWAETRYVSEETYHARSVRGYIAPGDIILSREGTVGVAAIVDDTMKVCMGQRLVQLRVDENIAAPRYILEYLLVVLRPENISKLMVGSTSQHLNVRELRNLPIYLPELRLQREFVLRCSNLDTIARGAQKSQHLIEGLFTSLKHRAFTGVL